MLILFLPYLLYVRNTDVLLGIVSQQERIAKSIYLVMLTILEDRNYIDVNWVHEVLLDSFIIVYTFKCITLLFKKKIVFRYEMKRFLSLLFIFVYLLLTNFQPWYLMWFSPFVIWQSANNMRFIIQMQMGTLLANTIFLAYTESYKNGVGFFIILVLVMLMGMLFRKSHKKV